MNHVFILKYKKLSELAFKPIINKDSAGIDICSPIFATIQPQKCLRLRTDLAFEIPKGFYGRVAGRSSICALNSIDILGGNRIFYILI